MFQNKVVDIQDIPSYQTIQLKNIHPNYVKVIRMNLLLYLFLAVAISIGIYFAFDEHKKYFYLIGIDIAIIMLAIYPLLSYKNKKYNFRENDVIYTNGLFIKTTHIIPYLRLQHVVIKQGWYAKKLGLATLKLYTAANDAIDIGIPGLTLEDAERWKIFLLNRIQELEDDTTE